MVEICWTRGSYCGQISRHSVDRSTDSRWESGRFAAGWFRRLSLVRTSAICCRRWTLLDLSLHWKWGWTEYDRKTQHMLYFWKASASTTMLNSKVENVLLLVFSLLKKEEVSNWNVNSPHLVGFCRRKKNHNKSSSSVFESSIPSHRSLSPFMNIFAVFAFPNQMKNFTPINHLDDTWTDIGGQIKDRAQKWTNCRKEINVLVLKIKDDVYF